MLASRVVREYNTDVLVEVPYAFRGMSFPYFSEIVIVPIDHKYLRLSTICLAACCLTFSGCGGEPKPDGMPKLHPTVIQLTQESTPVEGASVQLVSETDGRWPIGGSTDANGTVSLKTYGRYAGVPEGKYKVLVSKNERERVGSEPQSMYDSWAENVYNLVDPVYSVPETTPLEIEVKPGKNSLGPFDLGRKIRLPIQRPPGT